MVLSAQLQSSALFLDCRQRGKFDAGGEQAERVAIGPSAQIKKLEHQLGHALFERRGWGLALTEAEQLARDHCEEIFATGKRCCSR